MDPKLEIKNIVSSLLDQNLKNFLLYSKKSINSNYNTFQSEFKELIKKPFLFNDNSFILKYFESNQLTENINLIIQTAEKLINIQKNDVYLKFRRKLVELFDVQFTDIESTKFVERFNGKYKGSIYEDKFFGYGLFDSPNESYFGYWDNGFQKNGILCRNSENGWKIFIGNFEWKDNQINAFSGALLEFVNQEYTVFVGKITNYLKNYDGTFCLDKNGKLEILFGKHQLGQISDDEEIFLINKYNEGFVFQKKSNNSTEKIEELIEKSHYITKIKSKEFVHFKRIDDTKFEIGSLDICEMNNSKKLINLNEGEIIISEFIENIKNGNCQYFKKKSQNHYYKFDGEFKNDLFEGGIISKIELHDGQIIEKILFEGIFEINQPKKGKYFYENNEFYEGEFQNNMRNGNGLYQWKNGTSFTGNWLDNKKNGEGVFRDQNNNNFMAIYKKDELIEIKGLL